MKLGDLVKFKAVHNRSFNVFDKVGIIIRVNVNPYNNNIGGKVLINDIKIYHSELSYLVDVVSEVQDD